MLRLICPSHHFKSHHQVLITVKCSASGMCLGHKSSDIHHRNKCKLIYTTISKFTLKKNNGLFIHVYQIHSKKHQCQTKKIFWNTKDNIYFIFVKNYWCILSIYCRGSFKIFFFLYSIVFVLWMSISGAGLFNIPRISCKKNIFIKTIEIFPLPLFEGRSEVLDFDFVINFLQYVIKIKEETWLFTGNYFFIQFVSRSV